MALESYCCQLLNPSLWMIPQVSVSQKLDKTGKTLGVGCQVSSLPKSQSSMRGSWEGLSFQSLAEDVIQGGVYENVDMVGICWMLFQSVGLVQHRRCSWQ